MSDLSESEGYISAPSTSTTRELVEGGAAKPKGHLKAAKPKPLDLQLVESEGIHFPVSIKRTTRHPKTKKLMYVGKFKGSYLLDQSAAMLSGMEDLKHVPYKRLKGPVYDLEELQKETEQRKKELVGNTGHDGKLKYRCPFCPSIIGKGVHNCVIEHMFGRGKPYCPKLKKLWSDGWTIADLKAKYKPLKITLDELATLPSVKRGRK